MNIDFDEPANKLGGGKLTWSSVVREAETQTAKSFDIIPTLSEPPQHIPPPESSMTDKSGAIINYCCVYAATGIYNPSPDLNSVLLHDENVSIRLLGLKGYIELVDRVLCPQNKENSDKLHEKTKEKNSIRRNTFILQAHNHAVIHVESYLPLEVVSSYYEENSEIQAYVKAPLKYNAENAFKTVSAAMTFARGNLLSKNYDFIHEQYYVTNNESSIIKFLNPVEVFEGGTMSEISMDEITVAKGLSSIFHHDKELKDLISIYSESLTPDKSGHLHAFIAAWTALEIFVAKQFKELQSSITISINGATTHKEFSNRMLIVMNDKYRLADKFAALSNLYDRTNSDADIAEFKRIKGVRDKFFHKMEGEVKNLPLEQTRQLVSKYFLLYLETKQEGFVFQRATKQTS
ncbi:hypothetical protein [Pseudomonas kilonensis]|uniref:hypothetical protein n=1 Tax=Pseudomonas kilonensis TaxID=132476 RepID=UPI0033931708